MNRNGHRIIGDRMFRTARERLPSPPEHLSAADLGVTDHMLAVYEDVVLNCVTYKDAGEQWKCSAQRIYQIVHKVAAKIRLKCPAPVEHVDHRLTAAVCGFCWRKLKAPQRDAEIVRSVVINHPCEICVKGRKARYVVRYERDV